MTTLLQKHNPQAEAPSTQTLNTIFTEYEGIRLPRTAALVQEARKQGDLRVVSGVAACKERNNVFREIQKQDAALIQRYAEVPL